MRLNRRKFLKVSSGTSFVLLTGCATQMLYDPTNNNYIEEIRGVLLSDDNSQLAVIGDDYHYVFQVPALLASTIRSPFASLLEAKFSNFEVRSNNSITGAFSLRLPASAPSDAQQNLRALGYRLDQEGLVYTDQLKGTRYRAHGNDKMPIQALSRVYEIQVKVSDSAARKTAKLLLTPLALAFDGTLMIGWAPIATGIALIFCTRPNGCS